MRLFVAVDLSDDARRAIAVEQKRIATALARSSGKLTLVRPEQLHLTLLFLGELPDARVPAVVEALNIPLDFPAFDMVVEGAGVFPPRGAPRALWIGVTGGTARLTGLQREIARVIRERGVAFDDRPFHPHLTLARWRESRSSDRLIALAAAHGGEIARTHVDRATLYQSRLSSAGPTYTPLAHATLMGREL
jgi:2'-5' RNA ligase